jgi:hypothetical protein
MTQMLLKKSFVVALRGVSKNRLRVVQQLLVNRSTHKHPEVLN